MPVFAEIFAFFAVWVHERPAARPVSAQLCRVLGARAELILMTHKDNPILMLAEDNQTELLFLMQLLDTRRQASWSAPSHPSFSRLLSRPQQASRSACVMLYALSPCPAASKGTIMRICSFTTPPISSHDVHFLSPSYATLLRTGTSLILCLARHTSTSD